MAKSKPDPEPPNVRIGKFDILATYEYARALLAGFSDEDAKARGMDIAVRGAKFKRAAESSGQVDAEPRTGPRDRKEQSSSAAGSFDKRVADKMGAFFGTVFLPTMKRLVAEGRSYDEVKRLVDIPTTWGAKITGEQFEERTTAAAPTRPAKRIVRRKDLE